MFEKSQKAVFRVFLRKAVTANLVEIVFLYPPCERRPMLSRRPCTISHFIYICLSTNTFYPLMSNALFCDLSQRFAPNLGLRCIWCIWCAFLVFFVFPLHDFSPFALTSQNPFHIFGSQNTPSQTHPKKNIYNITYRSFKAKREKILDHTRQASPLRRAHRRRTAPKPA